LGCESRFISLGEPRVHEASPLIEATLRQLSDADWWRQWNLDGVVLYSWAAPRYEPVARAIKSAGIKLVIKVDTGGEKSPRIGWWIYYKTTEVLLRDQARPMPQLLALLKTAAFYFFPSVHDRPMLEHLSHADLIGVESPLAAQLVKDICHYYNRPELAARVALLPHPVTNDMMHDPEIEKQDIILCVGRWDAYQKDTPKLVAVLDRVLAIEKDYHARIIGSSIDVVARLVGRLSPEVRARIELVGAVPHERLPRYYQEAKIHFVASRTESGPITAGEALCCGCSMVGPAHVPSLHFFTNDACGSLAIDRSTARLADALFCEIEAWRSGARDPVAMSALWMRRVHAPAVASAALGGVAALSSGTDFLPNVDGAT